MNHLNFPKFEMPKRTQRRPGVAHRTSKVVLEHAKGVVQVTFHHYHHYSSLSSLFNLSGDLSSLFNSPKSGVLGVGTYVSVVYTFVACSSPQDEKQDQIPEVHVNAAKERNTMYPINIAWSAHCIVWVFYLCSNHLFSFVCGENNVSY